MNGATPAVNARSMYQREERWRDHMKGNYDKIGNSAREELKNPAGQIKEDPTAISRPRG